MIQIHIDGVLAYDSRLDNYDLQTLKIQTGLNKGGTATIVMPPEYPAYSAFKPYKSIVEIRRDEKLKFRGRALPPSDDFYNRRTVTCEGELCFLRDAISRPYLYQDDPATVFTAVLGVYNEQVDESKRFKVGTITVTDPNDYIRIESENAETVQDTVNKLLDRCGGYIVFTTDPDDGHRVINWYAELGYKSSQVIEFGENLLDFSRDSSTNDSLATALLPYGAKDSDTGARLTIETVNGGVDYIVDENARALRGFILATETWDDVTEPENLLKKAQEWLSVNRNLVTALKLTALDLSVIDKSVDSFDLGDKIRVRSKPHSVDEDFQLTERDEDLLNPQSGSITLGKDRRSLTSADVAGDDKSQSDLHKVSNQIKSDYTADIAQAVQMTEQTLTTLIEQTSEAIRLMVSENYTTNDELTEALSTTMTQLSDQFLFEFNSLKATVEAGDDESRENFEELYKYIRFEGGSIILGSSENAITLTIENDLIIFKKNGQEFGWWDGVDFHTGNIVVEVNERAQFGNFAFVPRSNGSLSFLKVK